MPINETHAMPDKPIEQPLHQKFDDTPQDWTFQQRLRLNAKVLQAAEKVDVLPQLLLVSLVMTLNHTNLLAEMRLRQMLMEVWVWVPQRTVLVFGIVDKDLCLTLDKDLDKTGKSLTLSYVMSYGLFFASKLTKIL